VREQCDGSLRYAVRECGVGEILVMHGLRELLLTSKIEHFIITLRLRSLA
jgi:hypothetical protein